MRLDLYQDITLLEDIPESNLRRGDVAVLVDYVSNAGGGEDGAVLEVFNAVGESINVIVVPVSVIAPLSPDQMLTVRSLSLAV
ncbi:MAG: DUF4926 domain-containing protein [Caldilineales bacterium]|nr:DUF4926 domain-containing protein [Caldilineales bacterium]